MSTPSLEFTIKNQEQVLYKICLTATASNRGLTTCITGVYRNVTSESAPVNGDGNGLTSITINGEKNIKKTEIEILTLLFTQIQDAINQGTLYATLRNRELMIETRR